MNVGEVSNPVPMKTDDQKDAYRILLLKEKTLPHKATMNDYDRLQKWALERKKMEAIDKWINEKVKVTYIKINTPYDSCKFAHKWMTK
jgi:peptidyl-prolyl cis-trans isomerase SurA